MAENGDFKVPLLSVEGRCNNDNEQLRHRIAELETENLALREQKPRRAKPAAVGLAGFGGSTLLLQIHNLGLMGVGPVLWLGLTFGGIAQLIAGTLEFQTGDTFGFCAFTSFGTFWIAMGLMFLGDHFGIYKTTEEDVGYFLLVFTIFQLILLITSLNKELIFSIIMSLLLVGFILFDFSHFLHIKSLKSIAAGHMLIGALGVWYLMTGLLFEEAYGKKVLPVGRSVIVLYQDYRGRRRQPNQVDTDDKKLTVV